MNRAGRARGAVVVLVTVLAVLGGCATVPGSSDVTVLRRLGDDGAEPSDPSGPVRGAGPLETARGWVLASRAPSERHEAARAFLTPQAAGRWDDGASPTVVGDQVDTVFGDRAVAPGQAVVRVRAERLGVLSPEGAFLSRPGVVDLPLELAQTGGQWRIASLPSGTLVRRSDLRAATRQIRVWFVDALRGAPVADVRYIATSPASSVTARAVQLLLAGPSPGLAGAASSALPRAAALRSAVGTAPDGTTVVDLASLGALDDQRRTQIAQQVALTLAGVGVPRVRLLVDGVPLLPGRPDVGVEEVVASLPRSMLERRELPVGPGDGAAPPAPPALLVSGGRVRTADGVAPAGPAGAGAYDAVSAGLSTDGQLVAVVDATPGPAGPPGGVPGPPVRRLLAGTTGTELTPTGIEGGEMTTPTWPPDAGEVWTVVDGARVVRAVLDPRTRAFRRVDVEAGELTAAGRVTALRFSPDGVRVAAVVGGRVAVGAVARDAAGGARVTSVTVLRPDAVSDVVDVGWTRTDRLVAVGARPDRPVALLSADGFALDAGPSTNLTPPVTAVAASPGRPLVAVDQSGAWTLPGADASVGAPGEVWRSLPAVGPGAVPAYPG